MKPLDPADLEIGERFHVAGCREVFVLHAVFRNRLGAVVELHAWSETKGQWRVLYVGKRPRTIHGLTVRPYRIRKVKGKSKKAKGGAT